MRNRWLVSGLLVLTSLQSFSQVTEIAVTVGKSHREGTNFNPPCPNPPLCDFYKMVSWNDSQILQYTYEGKNASGQVLEFLNWRMVFPLNYDPLRVQKYPMIVMLHGAGESGRIWTGNYNYPTSDIRFDNNGHNILHGGQQHLNAVNLNPSLPNSFPGIVIWPQASYNGAWENGWNSGAMNETGEMVTKVVEWIIQNINVDPDRIAVHGLSNGGKGTWEVASKRPDLFAAALPMSGVGSNSVAMSLVLNTTPLWLFQGGTDTNPRPQAAVDAIAALQAQGGNPRYTLYPTLGHGVWNTAYAEPDFFPWIKSKTKKDIYVFGGDPNICAGNNLQLGFSANMAEYIWVKDDVDIEGSDSRFITVNEPGVYKVKYRRQVTPLWETDAWAISNPVTIGVNPSTFSPLLTNTGSTILPTLAGVNDELFLTAPNGYTTYYWYKNGSPTIPIQPANSVTSINTVLIKNNQGNAGQAGNYTVKVLLPNGCPSEHSNIINVTYDTNGPTAPTVSPNPPVAISPTEINLQWSNVPQATSGYEVWRIRFGGSGYGFESYKLAAVVPANTTSFIDTGLRPEGNYRYRIRSVNSGGGTYSGETNPSTVTFPDLIPPTAPSNLVASGITDTQLTLSWDPATDNDKVYQYQIYNGSTLIGTLTGGAEATTPPATSFLVTALEPNTINLLNVRAIDWKGNYSPFADGISVSPQDFTLGLDYRYYQLSGGTLPLLLNYNYNTEPTRIGPATINTNLGALGNVGFGTATSPYIVTLEGYLDIPTTGTYQFRTNSNDGIVLFIDYDNTGYKTIINNDVGNRSNAPGLPTIGSPVTFTSTGKFPIKIAYSQLGSGAVFDVEWDTPTTVGTVFANLPSGSLFRLDRTFYYLRTGSPNPSLTASWSPNSNGSGGTSPSNFTSAQTYFVVANNTTVNLTAPLSITGSGSKLIVGNGSSIAANGSSNAVTLTLSAALTATVEANQNAIINVNDATIPKFGQLHATSTVNFSVPGGGPVNLPNALFGNVVLNAAQYNLPLSMTTVKGNLTLVNGVTTTGQATNLSTLRVGGNLIVNNTSGNPFPATGANQYALVFSGGSNHTVSFANPINPNFFSIQTEGGDQVEFTNLSNNTFTVGSTQGGGLSIKGGSSLKLGNNNLVVNGRGGINSNNETGALSMQGGNLTLSTTATQNHSLYFSATDWLTNLTIATPANNRLSLLSTVGINNLVTVTTGELNAGVGYLRLRSTSDAANGTARIGPLLNGATVGGQITMERYMSGEGRIYRYISSPVSNVTAQELQAFFPITGNFQGASTGTGITSATASMFHYNETLNPQYQQFPSVGGNIQETLQVGKGYVPFIREGVAATVLTMVGEPYQGTVPFVVTGNTTGAPEIGYNLLGNPYPAPIKWTGSSTGGWNLSGVNNTVYVRENIIGGATSVKSHNGTTGTNGWDGVIAPGQAFWVRTTALSPGLIVNENAKQTVDGAFYRQGGPENTLEIVMKSATAEDATIIQLIDGATPAFDTNLDGVKLDNTFFNLSSLTSDGKALVINQTTSNYCEQEIKLRTTNTTAGTYTLDIHGVGSILSGDEVTFFDNFTQTEKVISDSELYTFSITADPASKADGRFTLRLRKVVKLNQTLGSIAACEEDNPIIKVNNAQPGVTYQAFHEGVAISEALTSSGGVLELPVSSSLLAVGVTTATVKAGFKGCKNFELPVTVQVERESLPQPEIISKPLRLIASTEQATYQWYRNGEELVGQTNRELTDPLDGVYFVKVTQGSCTKASDARQYVVTGIEKPVVKAHRLYPNPTQDRITVELEESIDFMTMRVISPLGQSMPATYTRLSDTSAEVEFSQFPVGLYVLQVNEKRYRVIRK